MPSHSPGRPRWRRAADYEALRSLDRPGFAWEFLRRSFAYRETFAALPRPPQQGAHLLVAPPVTVGLAGRFLLVCPRRSGAQRSGGDAHLAA